MWLYSAYERTAVIRVGNITIISFSQLGGVYTAAHNNMIKKNGKGSNVQQLYYNL